MGGGGGAGSNNDSSTGFASSGSAGGGIVFLRAGGLSGSGTIRADGADVPFTPANDGSGGGGAGGTIVVHAVRSSGVSLTLSATGGDGGSNTGSPSGSNTAHGPGGGGGGGFIASSVTASTNVSGGAAGTTTNGGAFGASYGATNGSSGSTATVSATDVNGQSSGGQCTPTVVKAFAADPIGLGATSRLTITLTNPNPTLAMTAVGFTDTYPAAIRNAATPALANTCTGGTAAGAANGASTSYASGGIPANASCTHAITVTASTVGTHTNTIAVGGVLATVGGATNVASTAAATDTLTVSPGLSATKSSTLVSDPLNASAQPKSIPGSRVRFDIVVNNPGSIAIDAGTIAITDAVPAGAKLVVHFNGTTSGPVSFVDGSPASGTSYTFTALGSTTDGVEFSNNGGSTWTYVPTPDASGADAAVTHLRVTLGGAHAAGAQFTVSFLAVVK